MGDLSLRSSRAGSPPEGVGLGRLPPNVPTFDPGRGAPTGGGSFARSLVSYSAREY